MASAIDPIKTQIPEPEKFIEKSINCRLCGQEVRIRILANDLKTAKRIPLSVLDIHGNPSHGLLTYLDREGQIRGQELVEKVQMNNHLPKTHRKNRILKEI